VRVKVTKRRIVFLLHFLKIDAPKATTTIKATRKIKNNILAMEAAPAAMPVKPKIAATIAIMKKIAAQRNIDLNI